MLKVSLNCQFSIQYIFIQESVSVFEISTGRDIAHVTVFLAFQVNDVF